MTNITAHNISGIIQISVVVVYQRVGDYLMDSCACPNERHARSYPASSWNKRRSGERCTGRECTNR